MSEHLELGTLSNAFQADEIPTIAYCSTFPEIADDKTQQNTFRDSSRESSERPKRPATLTLTYLNSVGQRAGSQNNLSSQNNGLHNDR